MQIAFIGGGNMATALISGLLRNKRPGISISVADPSEDARKRLRSNFGIETQDSAAAVVVNADVIVLAIKPQVMPLVLKELKGKILPTQLVLSIAAGTSISTISGALHPEQAVVRSMPNTPALIGAGIAGLYANAFCKQHHRDQAERVLSAGGESVWIDSEQLMDAVTAVSGSGPAYFFLLTEALARAGEQLGLPADVATKLATRTCIGAGAMLANTTDSPAELRKHVTSPGGTTQAAIEAFEKGGLRELVLKAAESAEQRGLELSRAES
jgi:pyrroline-5-carboxylate reductase